MSLLVEIRPGPRPAARAVYRRSELTLDYALSPAATPSGPAGIQATADAALGIRPLKVLAIADGLVLVFSGPHAALTAFDAYTNIDLWTRTTDLPIPEVAGTGAACLVQRPADTDRIDLRVAPSFQYSERQARLRIELGPGRRASRHSEVSDCLIVGLDDEGLATLDVMNLRIE